MLLNSPPVPDTKNTSLGLHYKLLRVAWRDIWGPGGWHDLPSAHASSDRVSGEMQPKWFGRRTEITLYVMRSQVTGWLRIWKVVVVAYFKVLNQIEPTKQCEYYGNKFSCRNPNAGPPVYEAGVLTTTTRCPVTFDSLLCLHSTSCLYFRVISGLCLEGIFTVSVSLFTRNSWKVFLRVVQLFLL